MPISKPCSGFGQNADSYILAQAKEKLSQNWRLIIIFVVTCLLCTWILVRNAIVIYSVWVDWRANVRAMKKEIGRSLIQDVMDPAYDDEYYQGSSDTLSKSDFNTNAVIRRRLRNVRKSYGAYNKSLQLAGKDDDVIDERILAGEHDSYPHRQPKREDLPRIDQAAANVDAKERTIRYAKEASVPLESLAPPASPPPPAPTPPPPAPPAVTVIPTQNIESIPEVVIQSKPLAANWNRMVSTLQNAGTVEIDGKMIPLCKSSSSATEKDDQGRQWGWENDAVCIVQSNAP